MKEKHQLLIKSNTSILFFALYPPAYLLINRKETKKTTDSTAIFNNNPKMSNFIMLCDVLECNADYFLSGIIKTDVSNQITDLVATLNPEEKKTVLILLNAYIHREDAVIMDESAYQNN